MPRLGALVVGLLMLAPRAAWACPSCFGQSDAPMAKATNNGILLMLVVVVAVLSGFAAFIIYLNRRARLAASLEQAAPPAAYVSSGEPHEGIAQCGIFSGCRRRCPRTPATSTA
jgi:hypothetical protein